MSWELASFLILGAVLARRLRLVRALAAAVAGRRPGRRPGGAGDRRPHRLRRLPQRQADDRHRHLRRLRARRRPGLRGRRAHRAGLQLLVRPGPVDALADGGLGALRACSARRSALGGRNVGRLDARRGMRLRRRRLRRPAQLLADGDLRRRPLAASASSLLEARAIPFDAAHAIGNVALPSSPARRWCGCWSASASASSGGAARGARGGADAARRRTSRAARLRDRRRCGRAVAPARPAAGPRRRGRPQPPAGSLGAQNGDGGFGDSARRRRRARRSPPGRCSGSRRPGRNPLDVTTRRASRRSTSCARDADDR